MNTTALSLMIGTQLIVTCITLYFFFKVLTAKKTSGKEDSYTEE